MNDDHISPNCEMRKIVSQGKPHLCLFAVKEISPGNEITYNYGDAVYPWRLKVGFCYGVSLAFNFSIKFSVQSFKPVLGGGSICCSIFENVFLLICLKKTRVCPVFLI